MSMKTRLDSRAENNNGFTVHTEGQGKIATVRLLDSGVYELSLDGSETVTAVSDFGLTDAKTGEIVISVEVDPKNHNNLSIQTATHCWIEKKNGWSSKRK